MIDQKVNAPESASIPTSFEDAMKRLEEIATLLDGDRSTLDESLSLYEEGMRLIRYCTQKLDTAEQKIRVLNPENE